MLPKLLRSWLEAWVPPLEPADPAERISARLVSAIGDLLLVGTLAFTAIALLGPASAPFAYRVTLPLGVVLLYGLRRLVRSGHVRPAATILCIGGWLIIAADLQLHGPHTVAVGAFLLMIVIGGLTLGPVAAISLATITVVALAVVMFQQGRSPTAFVMPSQWTRWVHYSTQLLLVSVLVAWWAQGMRRLVRQLRESEARHAQLLEDTPDATVTVDRDGVITYWNSAAEQMLGYPRSTFIGRHWDTVPTLPRNIDHVDRARTSLSHAMGGANGPVHELELVHREGHTVTVEVKSVPLHHGGQIAGVMSTVRDISARKKAEHERTVLEEQLVSAQRMEAVGRFAGGIAHDFNNILTIIFNAAEVMRGAPRDAADGAIDDVLEAATRGASLARQLLTFSRHQPSEARATDVNATLVALKPMLARLVGEDVAIEMDLDEGRPFSVLIGPGQLDQVLLNLTINARDAMPRGGTIRVSAKLATEPGSAKRVEVAFSDTGFGMDASTIARAFDPFFSTKGERGSGLGLSIVKRIVSQAGGTIQCESVIERGTTFRIALPLVSGAARAPSSDAPKAADAAETATRAKRRIVLVDDDPLVRFAVARALQSAGVTVDSIAPPLVVDDVQARLRDAYALVTDVVMPGMTGPDLVDELRRRGCKTPVVFVSGYAEHALLARIRSTVGASLLTKPFTAEDVLARASELSGLSEPSVLAPLEGPLEAPLEGPRAS
jgi:two-component system, cell cycle sensor histidine kinase and response regulator CckA